MAVAVHLPKVGMTMEEGRLVRWLVEDGAEVERGQPIFEMETEKVEMEVEADGSGHLRRLVDEGTTLEPGAVVACLLEGDEHDVPAELRAAAGRPPAGEPAGQAEAGAAGAEAAPASRADAGGRREEARVMATPIARRLAREHGVDLAAIAGSGPGGRVTERDVRAHVDGPTGSAELPAETAPAGAPYEGMRRTIGERMRASLRDSAQLTLVSEARVDEAMRMLHGLNREWRADRVSVSLTSLVVRAAALALHDHPRLASRIEGDRIVEADGIHVGVAVNLDDGLIVPVVQRADERPLKEVAAEIASLSERARSGGLGVQDVTGGSFTVTSLETLDIDAFTPIINPPQAAILGVGRVHDVAVFDGDRVSRGQATTLSLTIDHRVVDGAPGARFLARVAELLARPYMLM